ncbi:MAG TPA: hypothetical protein VK466_15995 [Terriglobales bacterium]|nr:hypothetical protein [Terriglobales bacterium]
MFFDTRRRYASALWKRLALAVGLIVVAAMAYAAKQSTEQAQPAAAANSAAKTSLDGTWKLNREQSDDAHEKLRSAMQDHDQNSPMGRHGGMGGGGMGGGGIGMGIPGIGGMGRPGGPGGSGGMGRGSDSDEQRARLRDLVDPPEQLTVAQKGPEVDMTDPQYRERELFTDGRNIEKSKDAMQMPVKAHWNHEALVTEEKGPNGEKISHSYELAADGKQLTDTLTLESKKLHTPLIIRSVYDKTGSEGAN